MEAEVKVSDISRPAMSRREKIKADRESYEKDQEDYLKEIVTKPILYLSVQSVDGACNTVDTFLPDSIILFVLEMFGLSRFFTIYSETLNYSGEKDNPQSLKVRIRSCVGFICAASVRVRQPQRSPASHLRKVYVADKDLTITGLSAILRFILKFSALKCKEKILTLEESSSSTKEKEIASFTQKRERCLELLGFRQNCLATCAEVSIWTKFCEFDMINTLVDIVRLLGAEKGYCRKPFPMDLLRFEHHLQQPVKTHNFRKKVQLQAKKDYLNGNDKELKVYNNDECLTDLPHVYAEGPNVTLADVILFPIVHICQKIIGNGLMYQNVPKVMSWFSTLQTNVIPSYYDTNTSFVFEDFYPSGDYKNRVSLRYPCRNIYWEQNECPKESLYESDPSRYNPRMKMYTNQGDVMTAIEKLNEAGVSPLEVEKESPLIDWENIPIILRPEGGSLPQKRWEKKSDQLKNLVHQVLNVYKHVRCMKDSEITIVDFCSGGGHLGLIIAYMLPDARIYLVENKEESLRRAYERVKQIGFTNVSMFQSNVSYFDVNFDIGCCLHACGSSSDLVLKKCFANNASFVCTPCCYGSIRSNHVIEYPCSSIFKSTNISQKQYFVIAHAADQTEQQIKKFEQGRLCMSLVDSDRVYCAREKGYIASLKIMVPETASPKNHVIIGLSPLLD